MENVLITGGLGFVGSNLAHHLVNLGKRVTILSRTADKFANVKDISDNIELVVGDISHISKDSIKGKDTIFHCASTTDNYNILTNPFVDVDVNCTGTLALLESCKKDNPYARIVYLSTFFVNGNLDKLPATPDSPCNPLGIYPAARLAGERFCQIYGTVFGLDVVIPRLTNVFGPREQMGNKKKAAFNNLIRLAIEDKEIPIYKGGNFVRDYIYVADVAHALTTIAEKGDRGKVYYVGRGEGVKFKDLINIVIQEAGGGRLVPIDPPEFHKKVGINDFYCDNADLKNLGWAPQFSIQEGVRETIKWYRGAVSNG